MYWTELVEGYVENYLNFVNCKLICISLILQLRYHFDGRKVVTHEDT